MDLDFDELDRAVNSLMKSQSADSADSTDTKSSSTSTPKNDDSSSVSSAPTVLTTPTEPSVSVAPEPAPPEPAAPSPTDDSAKPEAETKVEKAETEAKTEAETKTEDQAEPVVGPAPVVDQSPEPSESPNDAFSSKPPVKPSTTSSAVDTSSSDDLSTSSKPSDVESETKQQEPTRPSADSIKTESADSQEASRSFKPARPVTPVIKPRGTFMDVVHPSSDMRSGSVTPPSQQVSRQAGHVMPKSVDQPEVDTPEPSLNTESVKPASQAPVVGPKRPIPAANRTSYKPVDSQSKPDSDSEPTKTAPEVTDDKPEAGPTPTPAPVPIPMPPLPPIPASDQSMPGNSRTGSLKPGPRMPSDTNLARKSCDTGKSKLACRNIERETAQ